MKYQRAVLPRSPLQWSITSRAKLLSTYSQAVNWWHAQMDIMLDLGIDGWKCDGTDPYIVELAGAKGFNGSVGWQCVWRRKDVIESRVGRG